MRRFNYSLTDDIYYIKWINAPIPDYVYAYIKKIMMNSNDHTIINSINKPQITYELKEINQYYGTNIRMEQYISIRNTLLKQKTIKKYHNVKKIIGTVTDEYNNGRNIISISKRHDYPPSNLLKSIFICQGYDENTVNGLFRLKVQPETFLSPYDCKQYNLSEKCDIDSMTQQLIAAKVATDNETLLVNFFKKLGVKLSTQEELVEEQMQTHGRAVVTPDILFTDTVYINNVQIHWIEYKDYACTDAHYLLSRNIKQVEKYTKKWGTGAICYNHSFVSDIIIPDTLILDATALGIKFFN